MCVCVCVCVHMCVYVCVCVYNITNHALGLVPDIRVMEVNKVQFLPLRRSWLIGGEMRDSR